MIVADTDVVIDYLTGRRSSADRVREELAAGRLGITSISRFELWAGVQSPQAEAALAAILDRLPCRDLTASGADRAAAVRRDLEEKGEGIGMADTLIAGIALAHGDQLLTRNRKHFERVSGLVVVSP